MDSMIKWLAIGIGGYFLLNRLGVIGVNLGEWGPPQYDTPLEGEQSGTGVSSPTVSNTKTAMAAKASQHPEYVAQGGKMTFDQWNYVLAEVSSTNPIVSWEQTNAASMPRTSLWSLEEWYGFVSPKGVSGMGNISSNRFLQNIRSGGTTFGEQMAPFME